MHITQAACTGADLVFPAAELLPFSVHVFLSLRGYDNMSHIVFINITCFLDLAAVSARQHTGKKRSSLAQQCFSLG